MMGKCAIILLLAFSLGACAEATEAGVEQLQSPVSAPHGEDKQQSHLGEQEQKEEAGDVESSEKPHSLDEVVKTDKMHNSVKQTLVEEEKLYSLMSFNFRKGAPGAYNHVDYYVRHMNRATMVSTITGPMDRQDSTFKVIHALCEPGKNGCPEANPGTTGCISLESVNFPGYFFGSTDTQAVRLLKADGSEDFNQRASLCIQPGLADQEAVSLEFLGRPGIFLRHSGYSLFACTAEDQGECIRSSRKEDFKPDSTFYLKAGLFMGRCGGPDATTKCTCFPGFLGEDCTLTCPGRARNGAMVKVCSGQGDCTMSESGAAECHCKEGFLGKDCDLLCPRDENENLCGGHGKCAVNDKFEPVCMCDKGFLGDVCDFECPGNGNGNVCSAHGSCFVQEADPSKKQPKRAECSCDKGFKGFSCDDACPTDPTGAICANHGKCILDVNSGKAKCACAFGWRGEDCNLSCPRDAHGAVCGGQGFCSVNKEGTGTQCKCKKGFGGQTCNIKCPGMNKGAPCSDHGTCVFDENAGTAKCECHKTHLGEACSYRCPMDDHSELACGGEKRGTCVKDPMSLPDKTRCDCNVPYVGTTCRVQCPMFQGSICAGNGECFIKKTGSKTMLGICKCDEGFVGHTCSEGCPKDEGGNTCSGHGACGLNDSNRAWCDCEEGWNGPSCSARICRTEKGIFNKQTQQCTCAQSEVCCTEETHRLAAMMKNMLTGSKKMALGQPKK
jgi:hypothetical protein